MTTNFTDAAPIQITWPQGCSGTISILAAPSGALSAAAPSAVEEHRVSPSVPTVRPVGYPAASLSPAPLVRATARRGDRWCEDRSIRICRIEQWRLSPREVIEEALRAEPAAEPDQQRAACALLLPAGGTYGFELALGEPGHVELLWRPDERSNEELRRLDSKGRLALTKTAQQWLGSAAHGEVEAVASVVRSLLCLRTRRAVPVPDMSVRCAQGGAS
jgi:hypothetical protein